MNAKSNEEYLSDDEVRDLIYSEFKETMLDFEIESEMESKNSTYGVAEKSNESATNEELINTDDLSKTDISEHLFQSDEGGIKDNENYNFVSRREKINLSYSEDSKDSKISIVDKESNKKLRGWSAAYELAKIAQKEGIDLSTMGVEEYEEYAISNCLVLDDAQIKMNPSQRNCISIAEVLSITKKEGTLE